MPLDKPHPRNIRDIAMNNSDPLAVLYKHSVAMLGVQKSIRLELGSPLGQHLHVANLNTESITIFTDSQAWATKLRFHTSEIARIARKVSGFTRLDVVRIRVSPALLDIPESRHPISISPATSRLLATVAGSISDASLQSVLLKISLNTGKP